MDLAHALAEADLHPPSLRPGTYELLCPRCSGDRRKKNRRCLSLTIRGDNDAVWVCQHCDWTDNFRDRSRNDGQRRHSGNGSGRPHPAPLREFRRPTPEPNPQISPETLRKLADRRSLSAGTIEAAGVYETQHFFPQVSRELPCLAFPYRWRGELVNVKYRSANKNFAQEKFAEPTLYNVDAIEAGEDLIWTEGEFDTLACIEAGRPRAVSLALANAPDQKHRFACEIMGWW